MGSHSLCSLSPKEKYAFIISILKAIWLIYCRMGWIENKKIAAKRTQERLKLKLRVGIYFSGGDLFQGESLRAALYCNEEESER